MWVHVGAIWLLSSSESDVIYSNVSHTVDGSTSHVVSSHSVKQWTLLDTVYFGVVTMSTSSHSQLPLNAS